MGLSQALLTLIMRQLPDLVGVVVAKPAQQLIGARELAQLLGRKRSQEIRHLLADLEPEHGGGPVLIQQTLHEEQVGEIEILDLVQNAVILHVFTLRYRVY